MTVSAESDDILDLCNETELIQLASRQGLGRLRRGIPRNVLVGIVKGSIDPLPEHLAGTNTTRRSLEEFIGAPDYETGRPPGKNWMTVRNQIPGCTGLCSKFPCSEGRHASCFVPNDGDVEEVP